jgi:hypothetical protein
VAFVRWCDEVMLLGLECPVRQDDMAGPNKDE